jgi:CDP-diacylglycerol--glycerol-3-phosphate 3-phosphatidyltransferase
VNLANRLTLTRLLLVPFFLIFTIEDNVYTRIAALVFFLTGSLTDFFDGYVARKQKAVTELGTFLDPLADKLFISAAFISFVQLQEIYVPAWMVVAIIGREFLITGLRTLAARRGRILGAETIGKFKTTGQIMTIILILIVLIANSALESKWGISKEDLLQSQDEFKRAAGRVLDTLPYCLSFLTTVLTIVSGYAYLRKHKDLLLCEKS